MDRGEGRPGWSRERQLVGLAVQWGGGGGRCPHATGGLFCERGHLAFGAQPGPSGHEEFYFSPGNMECITNHFPAIVEMFLLWK